VGGLELGGEWLLVGGWTGQIGSFLTFQYAINVVCGAPVLVVKIGPIGDQPASSNLRSCNVDRWQLVACGRCNEQIGIGCYWTRHLDHSSIRPPREGRDGAFDLGWPTQVD